MLAQALLLASALATPSLAASAADWQHRSIYQVVTDRFAVSDDSGPACDTADRKYCGGSYKGIVNHLDYIQSMGFDAIWISPVVENFEGKSEYGEPYHGYWPSDFTKTNSHFGTPEDLKALSAELHKRKMFLMVDVVVNHLAATSSTPDFASSFKSLPSATDFHPFCFVKDFNNQTESEQCWLGDDKLALVDVNTEDDKVVSQLHDMATKLVSDFSVDGLRIDTVKHVRKDFWPDFVKAAGVFTMGEVLSNETSYIAPYTEVMDSVLDYSTWFPLVAAFQTSDGDCSALAKHVDSLQSSFKNGQKMTGSFLENHDQPRFPSLSKDSTLGTNALVWPFVTDGIPILYYGQEQGFAGGPDPSNREALWSAAYAQEKPLVKQVKALNLARKAAIGANPKFLVTAVKFPSPSKSQIAVAKPPMLALLTNVGSSAKAPATWSLDAASTGYAPNTDLVDVLSCTKVTTDAKGAVSTTSKAGAPIVLVPASTLAKGGALCGTLATGSSTGSSSSNGTTTGAQPKSSAQGMTLTTSVLVFALSFVGATFALV